MNDEAKGTACVLGFLGLGLVGLLIVTVIWSVVSWVWGVGSGVTNRVVNPDAIVQNYEYFEQQLKDIKAVEGQIKDAEESVAAFKKDAGDAKEWKFDQREEYGRLNSNLTGLRQSRRKMVEDYNARAAMISRNLWKSSDCPQHIEE